MKSIKVITKVEFTHMVTDPEELEAYQQLTPEQRLEVIQKWREELAETLEYEYNAEDIKTTFVLEEEE